MKFGMPFLARLALGVALAAGATAGASAQSSLGQSGLVGKPEGVTIVADPAQLIGPHWVVQAEC